MECGMSKKKWDGNEQKRKENKVLLRYQSGNSGNRGKNTKNGFEL
jgi:hypothetical protein